MSSSHTVQDLIKAILKGNIPLVRQYVEIGVDVNKPDEEGITPLMHAINLDEIEIVSLLISQGENPGQAAPIEQTPLFSHRGTGTAGMPKLIAGAKTAPHPASRRTDSPAGGGSAGAADKAPSALLTEEEIRSILEKVGHPGDSVLQQSRLITEFENAVLDLGRDIEGPSKIINIAKWQRALFEAPLGPPASIPGVDFYGFEKLFSIPDCIRIMRNPTFRSYLIEVIAEPKYQCKFMDRLFRRKQDETKLMMFEDSLLPKLFSMGEAGREFCKQFLTSNHAISNWLKEKPEGDTRKTYGLKCNIFCRIINFVYGEVPYDFHLLFIRELTCIPSHIVFKMSPESEAKRPREFVKTFELFDEARRIAPYMETLLRLENRRIELSEKSALLKHIETMDEASQYFSAIFQYTDPYASTILLNFLFEKIGSEEEPLRLKKFLSLLSADQIVSLLRSPHFIIPLMHNERYAIDFFITLICQRDFVEKINTSRTFSECLFSEYFMGRLRVTTAKELSSECSFGLLRFSMLEKYALRILSQSTEAVDALNKASSEIKLTITILVIEGLIANHLMNRVYDKINVSECVIGFILKALPENIAEIEAMFVTNPEVKKILKEAKQKQKKQAKKERDLKKKLEKAKAKEKESKILEDEAREAERRAQKAFEEKREMERMIEIRALEEKTQREALEKAKRESLTKGSNRERKPRIEADIEITEETLRERMKHVEEYLSESESARLASEFNLYHRLCELITKNSPESLATYLAKSSPSPSEKESFREFFKLAKELQETVEKNKTDFSKAIKNRYWHDRVLERINQILSQAENRKMHDILPLRIEPTVEAPHTLPAREKAIRDFKKLHGTSGTVVSAGDGDGKPLETSRHELALAFMRKRVEAPTSSLSILPKPLGLASDFPGREAEQRFSIAETGTLKQIFESYEKISSTYALIIASPEEELMLQTTRNHYAHTPCLVEALSPEGLAWLLDQWQKEDRQAFIPIIHDYFNHLSLEDKALLLDRRIFWLSQTCNPKIISFLLAEIWEIGQASFFEKSGLYHLNERDRNLLRQLRNQTWHEIYGSDKSLIEEDSYQKMHTLFSRHASRAEENLSRRYQEDALGFHPHAS